MIEVTVNIRKKETKCVCDANLKGYLVFKA
jgi:hypothetical protein